MPGSPADETRDGIVKDIAKSQHYENKVSPLFLAGRREAGADSRAARSRPADQLRRRLRRPGGHGSPRGLAIHQQLRRLGQGPQDRRSWTGSSWPGANSDDGPGSGSPRLGGIEVGRKPVTITYELPRDVRPPGRLGLVSRLIRDRLTPSDRRSSSTSPVREESTRKREPAPTSEAVAQRKEGGQVLAAGILDVAVGVEALGPSAPPPGSG